MSSAAPWERRRGLPWRWWGDRVLVLDDDGEVLVLEGAAALVWAGVEPATDADRARAEDAARQLEARGVGRSVGR